jgi:cytochrome c-type biogenesis protein CcmF
VIGGAALDLWARTGREGAGARLGRLMRLPRADWGKAVAHAGLGVVILAVAAHLAWMQEDIRVADAGDRFAVGAYEIELREVAEVEGPNYLSQRAEVGVWRGGRLVAVVHPEKRFYPVAAMPTTEAGIDNGLTRDVYVVLGDAQADGGWAMRTYVKPFSNWIWGGAILMALGGLLSLSDRRLRVAAGAGRAAAVPVAAE